MARGIVIIIGSFVFLVWPQVGLGQGTIYTWIDSQGTVHYSDTPTGEARSIDDALPPAASFGTQSDTQPPDLPAQGVPSAVAANAPEREELFNRGEEEAEGNQIGQDEDFALGRDGPFGTHNSNAFED